MDAAIVAVTVYPGQARVTRRGTAALDAGERRITVGGLPLGLRQDSVRVAGSGPATVLGVDVRREHHPRSPDGTVEELRARVEELAQALGALDDEDAVLTARETMIGSVSRRTGSAFARALTADSAAVGRVAEVGSALAAQLAEVLGERRSLAVRRRAAQQELDDAQRRLAARDAGAIPDRMAVEVELDVADGGDTVELEVSYLVDNAGWESRHDVRLVGSTLTLTWFGLVTQHSGEDWPECDLRLSTARPASTVTVPELDPWFLQRRVPDPPRTMERSTAFAAAAAGGAPTPPPAMARDAVAVATVEHGAAAATYRPARPVAVPSDGSAHRATVAVVELPAELDHVTVPLRDPQAYLRATVVNTSEHTLRAGTASVFHDREFVGSTELATWAPGEEVELALGVDDRVRVQRALLRRGAGKAMLGTRHHDVAYKITVGNYGPRQASITVVDQLPVSRDEGIAVRDVVCEPRPAEVTELGEVTWRLQLDPGGSAELTSSFRVDVAKGVNLVGWRD